MLSVILASMCHTLRLCLLWRGRLPKLPLTEIVCLECKTNTLK
ncbi:hypothetical protein GLYMA_07G053351v4 [Glycine max]|nr:hypothetical protein GLYMA_07G053351v4 [Glycine max]KAH1085541.1 hypothetical protein GYH30_017485 [Glycine max]